MDDMKVVSTIHGPSEASTASAEASEATAEASISSAHSASSRLSRAEIRVNIIAARTTERRIASKAA